MLQFIKRTSSITTMQKLAGIAKSLLTNHASCSSSSAVARAPTAAENDSRKIITHHDLLSEQEGKSYSNIVNVEHNRVHIRKLTLSKLRQQKRRIKQRGADNHVSTLSSTLSPMTKNTTMFFPSTQKKKEE